MSINSIYGSDPVNGVLLVQSNSLKLKSSISTSSGVERLFSALCRSSKGFRLLFGGLEKTLKVRFFLEEEWKSTNSSSESHSKSSRGETFKKSEVAIKTS